MTYEKTNYEISVINLINLYQRHVVNTPGKQSVLKGVSLGIISKNFTSDEFFFQGKDSQGIFVDPVISDDIWSTAYTELKIQFKQNKIFSIEYILRGYYDNSEENLYIYVPSFICSLQFKYICHSSCGSCRSSGTEEDHKCTTCLPGYYKLIGTDNCYKEVDNHFLDPDDQHFHQCYQSCLKCDGYGTKSDNRCTKCQPGYDFLAIYTSKLSDIQQCVPSCKNSYFWLYDKQIKDFTCITNSKYCPIDYPFLLPKKRRCVQKCSEYPDEDCLVGIDEDVENSKKLIDKHYKELFMMKKAVNKKNYTINFYILNNNTMSNLSAIREDVSNIAFGECEELIRKEKSLGNQSLYVAVTDANISENLKETIYTVYTENWEKVDFEICKKAETKLMFRKYMPQNLLNSYIDEIPFEKVSDIQKNPDVLVNYCESFNFGDSDFTLQDRNGYYYKYTSMCPENCSFTTYDNNNSNVECSCKYSQSQTLVRKEGMLDYLHSINSNLKLVKCPKRFLEFNFGQIIYSLFLIGHIAIFSVYARSCKTTQPSPPIRILRNKKVFLDSFQSSALELNFPNKSFSFEKSLSTKKTSTSITDSNKEESKDNVPLIFNDPNCIAETKENSITGFYFDFSFFRFFRNSSLFYYIIFKGQTRQVLLINISWLLLMITVSFSLNGLLYSDKYIHETLLRKGTFSFVIEFRKIFYCIIFQYFFSKILVIIGFKLLVKIKFEPKENIEEDLRDRESKASERSSSNSIPQREPVKDVSLRIVPFIIFVLIIHLFFHYYISIFCSVYSKTQIKWATCSIIHILLYFCIVPFSITGVVKLLNNYAISTQNQYLAAFVYIISQL